MNEKRRVMKILSVLFAACLFIHSCARETPPGDRAEASDEMIRQAGQGIVSATFGTLSGNLGRAMSEGGVPQAIEFCSVEAIPLTRELAAQADVEVRRASHKPRNPVNRADEVEMRVIEEYIEQIDREEELSARFYRRDDRVYYYAPIRIASVSCLQCHGAPGTDIEEEHVTLIRSHYPQDEATGFSMGDLRGIWSVRMPADSVSVQEILSMLEE